MQMGTGQWQTSVVNFDLSAFSLFAYNTNLCGEMHFMVAQPANYWLLLQIQPNVLSISGCVTERKSTRDKHFFLPFYPIYKIQQYYNLCIFTL